MSRPRLMALLLALVTLAVYLPVTQFRFVNFDDNEYITDNPVVKSGLTLPGAKWAFTTSYDANWHPVTWLSHMADCELFGLHAGAHHAVNVLFHAANTALLFVLLWRLTRKLWPSALVAALFAWHPLHVESVAWVSERKDVLSTFFALLSMLSYARHAAGKEPPLRPPNAGQRKVPAARPPAVFLGLALLFFAVGLMAKPMLVTLPFVMLLLDFWPLQRTSNFKRLVWEKTPFFILTAGSCVVTLLAQHAGQAVIPLEQMPVRERLATAVVGVGGYLQRTFWPVDLCAIYLRPESIPVSHVVLALGVLLLVSGLAWRWRHSRPYFLMGWLWFLGTLVPVCGLVQVGNQALADRYTYIPSIGLYIALVFLADEVTARWKTPGIVLGGFAGLICFACIWAMEYQLQFWRDGESLFRRAVAVNPMNDVALLDLGVALDAQGRFDEALEVYHQAETAGSRRYQIYNNYGNVLGLLGRHAESLAQYRKAIELAPENAALHFAAGSQLAALGRLDEALDEFSTAGKLDPTFARPHLEAAKCLFKLGRDAAGVEEFRAAVRLDPGNYQTLATVAHYLATNENADARDGRNALVLALQANELSGQVQPMVMDILGMAFAENGDFTNAVGCARKALDLAGAAQLKNLAPLQQRLERYQNQQPWRESFRLTNAPAAN